MKITFLAVVFLTQISLASRSEITLSSAIEVSPREKLTAYDLVETKNLNPEELDLLKEIELADGKVKAISQLELIKKFKGQNAKFRFPSEVKILYSKSNVSRMEVERKIKNFLLAKCFQCDFSIQVNTLPQGISANWDLDLNIDFNKSLVMIPVIAADSSNKKSWAVVEVKKYSMTPVLARPVRIGETITEDMLILEKRMIPNYQDVVADSKSIIGLQAAKFLSAGQIISSKDLKKEQVLKKGQMVKAMSGQDSFEISISAQAEESGCIGDVVKIKNLDSQKSFSAKIVDRGLVRIE